MSSEKRSFKLQITVLVFLACTVLMLAYNYENGYTAEQVKDNTQSMFENLSRRFSNMTAVIRELQSEPGEKATIEASSKQDWWTKKKWKSDNNAVYQCEDYTPWKSLHIQGDNIPYNISQIKANFISMLEVKQAHCRDTVRAGKVGDGGWHVCVSPPYTPRDKDCLVYSFGINYDFSYDLAMVDKHKCTVRAYDPSMKKGKYSSLKPGGSLKIKDGLTFYKIGVGANFLNESQTTINKKGWHIQSFGNMIKANGDEGKIIDMLKMDVEYSEWASFEAMFDENSLHKVKQLSFEIHIHPDDFKTYFQTLIQLEKIGFRRYLMNRNKFCSNCFEAYYINMNFL